ncbi:MAG: hypothetical protein QOI00_1458 [Chloroflexota bacterium]|nr:hypothetical protein [Chloroflexota bacterium]
MTTLEVVCAVEGAYTPHSAAMLHSVLANRGDADVRVHYLHDAAVPLEGDSALAGMVERNGGSISFIPVDDALVAGLPTVGFTGKATWYRILLEDLLPEVDRALCLDADLIAADSLLPLWSTDLADSYLAAVTNVLDERYMRRPAELGLNPAQYFNAGVMLMNLERMRADGCAAKLRAFAVEHADELVLRDQDALNYVLAGRRLPLHPRWNCMNAIFRFAWAVYAFTPAEIDEARRSPAIRHFEGPGINKPWNYQCPFPHRELYARHRRETPWPTFKPEGRTVYRAARRQLGNLRRRLKRPG